MRGPASQEAEASLSGWLDGLLTRQGSTRSSGLIRVGLVLLLWNRFAAEMAPFSTMHPERLALGTSFFVSTLLLLVGFKTRLAAVWTGVTMLVAVYGFGVYGPVEPWRHHHTYLLAAASGLLVFTPCGNSLSVDRWLAVRRSHRTGSAPPRERGPVWGLTLLALQVSSVYLWSAYDKCDWAFLSGWKLERIFVYWYLGFRPDGALWDLAMASMAWATVVLEVALGVGLFVKPFRRWLVPAGIALHAIFYVVLPVGPFSLTMVLLYLAYMDPDVVHDTVDRLLGPARDT